MSEKFRGQKNFSLDKKNDASQKLQSYIDNANRTLAEVDRVASAQDVKEKKDQNIVLSKPEKIDHEKLFKKLPGQIADYIEALQDEKLAKTDLKQVQEKSWQKMEDEMDKLSDVYAAEADSRENKDLYQACVAFLNEEKGWSVGEKFSRMPGFASTHDAWEYPVFVTSRPEDIPGFFPVYRRIIRNTDQAVQFKHIPIELKEILKKFLENEKVQDPREYPDSVVRTSASGLVLGSGRIGQAGSYYYVFSG